MKKIRNTQSLSNLAYKELKNAILTGELSQGDALIENKLATDLNVSRTVVQRALLKLEADNLVIKDPKNNRMYVKKLKKQEIINLWEVRKALEKLAIKKVCQNRTQQDIEILYSFFDRFKDLNSSFSETELEDYAGQDQKFHRYIAELSRNETLIEILINFQLQVNTFNIGIIRYPEETLKEHIELIKAIENQESQKAEELMEEHLEKSMKMIQRTNFDNGEIIESHLMISKYQ